MHPGGSGLHIRAIAWSGRICASGGPCGLWSTETGQFVFPIPGPGSRPAVGAVDRAAADVLAERELLVTIGHAEQHPPPAVDKLHRHPTAGFSPAAPGDVAPGDGLVCRHTKIRGRINPRCSCRAVPVTAGAVVPA